MTIRRMMGLAVLASCLLPLGARAEPCEGNWEVEIRTASATSDHKGDRGTWVPATLLMDRSLARCAREFVLQPARGGRLTLTGPAANPAYQITNALRQNISPTGRDRYVMPLIGKQRMEFWLHIPGGRDLMPGNYAGDLRAQIIGQKAEGPRNLNFDLAVAPYVRAKLPTEGTGWISGTGPSVKLELGDLSRTNRQTLPVVVESNGFVQMSLSSQNQGSLKHLRNSDIEVPYVVKVAKRQYQLTDQVRIDVAQRPVRGQRVELVFENEAQPYARAGKYQDVVTISLFAR
ncbi:hypothetical protein [Ferrimonas balearica]|uniref:hypothetical protein n=1 Tax=Ferrimonas balearica TaxID=44012 RepID=UPI001C9623D5|nr:hypothetical protein [Ferrimonas balearica]MBY5980494.1 hypothetical protein [Ferrimonas balearica]